MSTERFDATHELIFEGQSISIHHPFFPELPIKITRILTVGSGVHSLRPSSEENRLHLHIEESFRQQTLPQIEAALRGTGIRIRAITEEKTA